LTRVFTVLLIGYGAVGKAVARYVAADPEISISGVIVHSGEGHEIELDRDAQVLRSVDELHELPDFALECAGHSAMMEHVVPLLERGVDVGIISTGSLAEDGLIERLDKAASYSGARLSMLSGAIGAIDALSAAKIGGLDRVIYTGTKPPSAWKGTAAENVVDLDSLVEPAVIFRGRAREATRLFPKNANVAATISLAGVGLDNTEVTLVADPHVTRNVHRIEACGAFGEMQVTMTGNPLPDNPKTSALTVYSAIRAIYSRAKRLSI
jgi:aspartate dehydrogenase